MKTISFLLINGLTIGVEHVGGDEDDDYNWLIAISLFVFRIILIDHKLDE